MCDRVSGGHLDGAKALTCPPNLIHLISGPSDMGGHGLYLVQPLGAAGIGWLVHPLSV
jgi:hypothetical protein